MTPTADAPLPIQPSRRPPMSDDPDMDGGSARRAADYDRIAGALDWLARHWRDHPSLEEAAAASSLSPHHFQRVFTRWAGVSPKVFVQALVHAQARAGLDAGDSVFDAALDAGFSGPSRLHDLFLAHEGVTPGQARRRGAGLEIAWGYAPSPFGRAVIAATPRGLCGLGFVDGAGEQAAIEDLRRRWPAANWTLDPTRAAAVAAKVFGGEAQTLELIGPPFHVAVWKALLRIPVGRTMSYAGLAMLAGKPGAYRAVGAAVGANPISWLIPCHRVLASDGRLTGYHWGLARKTAMLGLEASVRHPGAIANGHALS